MVGEGAIRRRFKLIAPVLNERTRRLWAAAEAQAIGRGGIAQVCRATCISRRAIRVGLAELRSSQPLDAERVRRPGGGRRSLLETDPTLQRDLETLVDPLTRGDPCSPLRWTCKSVRKLAAELQARGHRISRQLVAELLRGMHYSLQSNRKTKEGASHPDRDAQFQHISRVVRRQLATGQPAISVDTKKKELVGDFKNSGREWQPQGQPEEVRVHDFLIPELGRASPYGVYDLTHNRGWVSVGVDHDTAAFAVASIRWWWRRMGQNSYRQARSLLITADCGGSNGNRVRLWKWELQKLADDTGLSLHVCHFPPGTSKWNKIEHRLFSFITQNWRGRPLLSHAVIVNLIGSTRTQEGLEVRCRLDTKKYPLGVKISDQQMETVCLYPEKFHGEWNYMIRPRRRSN